MTQRCFKTKSLISSLIKEHSILFYAVNTRNVMHHRCCMRYLEYCNLEALIYAFLMAYLKSDSHTLRKRVMTGKLSFIK